MIALWNYLSTYLSRYILVNEKQFVTGQQLWSELALCRMGFENVCDEPRTKLVGQVIPNHSSSSGCSCIKYAVGDYTD